MIGARHGKAPQARDGCCRIARQAFGKSPWRLRQEHPACSQYIESGNPIRRDLADHKTRCDAASHILAGLLPKIAIERIHPARKLRTIVAWPKWFNDEWTRHREDAIKRA